MLSAFEQRMLVQATEIQIEQEQQENDALVSQSTATPLIEQMDTLTQQRATLAQIIGNIPSSFQALQRLETQRYTLSIWTGAADDRLPEQQLSISGAHPLVAIIEGLEQLSITTLTRITGLQIAPLAPPDSLQEMSSRELSSAAL